MPDVANIIKYLHTDGVETVYAIIRNMDNEFYDVTTSHEFETFVAANWATFKMAMAEVAAAGAGENVPLEGDWPEHLTTVGYYWVDFYIQAGGTAAQTDLLLSSILFFWNGTTLLPAEAIIGTPNGATVAADIAAVKAETVLIVADTGTTLPAAIISAHVDTDADIAAVKAETALIYADTDDLQTSQGDWATADVSGLATTTALAAVKAETALIVADTGELQTDWANGGRLDLILDSILADTSAMGGAGSNECTITVSDGDGDPIDGCSVWITTDEAGKNVVASGTTDESGVVTFMLDGGTYFSWRQLSGFNFDNPETIVVGA